MLSTLLNLIAAVLAALTVVLIHELSKYYISLTLLHPIHRRRADMKTNPLKYIDPIGIILFVFSYVGWQKPGEYNASRFKDKDRALIVLSLTGIMTNLLVLLAVTPIYAALYDGFSGNIFMAAVVNFFYYVLRFSFAIIIVNLLPIPPFDMTKIIYALNPSFYFKMIQNERVIQAVFILLIAFNVLSRFVDSLFYPLMKLFV